MTIINILGIETSCDETAASIISYNEIDKTLSVQSHIVESQNESHAPFGGVVPEIAARDHLSKIDYIVKQALAQAGLNIQDVTKIAVTLGPGLIGALMVGVMYARGIVSHQKIPLIGINHVKAHLAPCFFLPQTFRIKKNLKNWFSIPTLNFPILALTVSGGHCHLTLIKSKNEHVILGRTLDDACGEAFDKVAKLLGMGYPGGPALEVLAEQYNKETTNEVSYTHPFLSADAKQKNKYNFSYSGLKTATMLHIKSKKYSSIDIAYAFQNSAIFQLKTRVLNALKDFPEIKMLFVAGGVAQNKVFRKVFSEIPCEAIFAPPELCSDNATMIALQTLIDDTLDASQQHPFARYPY